jgi:hypothetical protein
MQFMCIICILSQEMKAISMVTIPSSIELLERIVKEEEQSIKYNICKTCTFTISMIPKFQFSYIHRV